MQKPTIKTKLGRLANGVSLGLVSGSQMRTLNGAKNDSYALGGHDLEEKKELPKKSIVLEDVPDSHKIAMHEVIERTAMDLGGWSYKKAHKYANSFERIHRRLEQHNIKKFGTLATVGKA